MSTVFFRNRGYKRHSFRNRLVYISCLLEALRNYHKLSFTWQYFNNSFSVSGKVQEKTAALSSGPNPVEFQLPSLNLQGFCCCHFYCGLLPDSRLLYWEKAEMTYESTICPECTYNSHFSLNVIYLHFTIRKCT